MSELDEAERERRKRSYLALHGLLLSLRGEDEDYWNAHTYSELIDAAVEALNEERARITAYKP